MVESQDFMKEPVRIFKIIKICSVVGFHSWCDSSVGKIRKPNDKLRFLDKEKEIEIKKVEPKLNWFQKLFK